MNVGFTVSGGLKAALLGGDIDFANDTFAAYLAREEFSFQSSKCLTLKNFKLAKVYTADVYVVAADKKIFCVAGNFITAGLITGNYITTNGTGNVGTYIIRAISADGKEMRVDLYNASTMANLGSAVDLRTVTITITDEATNTNGYNPGVAHAVTFVIGATGELIMEALDLSEGGEFGTLYDTANNVLFSPGFVIAKVRQVPEDGEVIAFARLSTQRLSV